MEELNHMFDVVRDSSNNRKVVATNQCKVKTLTSSTNDFVVNNDNIKMSFWGSLKSGKTSLLNMLIGRNILPVRATSATGIVTRIYYDPNESAKVIYKSGEVKDISLDDISEYILIKKKNIDEIKVLEDILRVDIGLAESILISVDLYDLPGDEDDFCLSEISYSACMQMDIILFVFSSIRLFSENEKQLIEELHNSLKGNLIYVINKMDYLDADDYSDIINCVDKYLDGKHSHGISSNIHYCSSKDAQIGIDKLREVILNLRNEPYWILRNKIYKHINF